MSKLLPNLIAAALLAFPVFGDSVLYRTRVPNAIIPQGEVQLVVRDRKTIVRSVIQTRFPEKVLAKIIKSEKRNWPDHPEMKTYIAALKKAFDEYAKRDRETALIIDFIAGPDGAQVDINLPSATIWCSLPLSEKYVQKNQEYILADAFGKESDAVIAALRKLNQTKDSDGN